MENIVNGQKIADEILEKVTSKVIELKEKNIYPKLGVILVGDDKPSQNYIAKKKDACRRVGIDFVLKKFNQNDSQEMLISQIEDFQKNENLSGLIIQLPLPDSFDKHKVINAINPELDVDFLTDLKLGGLVSGNYKFEPPTPGAILEIFKYHQIELKSKKILIVGAGDLVGRPLANLLMHAGATITIANSSTRDLNELTQKADIIITATGQPGLINSQMIGDDTVIIDAGVSVINSKIFGDVDFESVKSKAKLVTPCIGGVGPITVAKLAANVVDFAEFIFSKNEKT